MWEDYGMTRSFLNPHSHILCTVKNCYKQNLVESKRKEKKKRKGKKSGERRRRKKKEEEKDISINKRITTEIKAKIFRDMGTMLSLRQILREEK